MTPFSETITSLKPDGAGYTVTPDENWSQGRTTFGGLVGALAVEAVRRANPGLPPLRSAQLSLMGPASGALHIRPDTLRAGKSTAFIGVDVLSSDELSMRAILTFGQARPSRHALDMLAMTHTTRPLDGFSIFDTPGAPRNTVNFEGRLVGGSLPFSGSADAELKLWLRHRDERPVDPAVSMMALADASPPAVFPLFRAPAPISTATWSIDFCGAGIQPLDWFHAHTTSAFVRDGYSLQTTTMTDTAGAPVLVSRQLVALYD